MLADTGPLLFISSAPPDHRAVDALATLLVEAGLGTWFDRKGVQAGPDWEFEIRQQLSKASLVLVCLSKNAIGPSGFAHEGMRFTVHEALKLPKAKVYPVRLNDCSIPVDIAAWHALDLFVPSASRKLLGAISNAIDGGARARSDAHDSFASAMQAFNAAEPAS